MNQELLHLLDQISREKGIDNAVLVDAVCSAVLSAARKRFGPFENLCPPGHYHWRDHSVFAKDGDVGG